MARESSPILTEVAATVSEDRAADLQTGYAALVNGSLPDGLLRTELLHGPDGQWRIQTLWRDRDALDAMRTSGEPAAPKLFREVGAEPTLTVLEVSSTVGPTSTDS